jgi:hypothetical protein
MLTLRDKIRATCHYLRMNPLTMVNPSRERDIRTRIAKLPTAEVIASMPREELTGLKNRIDRLMFDMDISDDSRTKGHALRNMIDKGLPPRRVPVLANNWYNRAISRTAQRKLVNSPETEDDRAFRNERVTSPTGEAVRNHLNMRQDNEPSFRWWCPRCESEVNGTEVTFEETHDPRKGGCGGNVISEEREIDRALDELIT